jgi:hypothetical protein
LRGKARRLLIEREIMREKFVRLPLLIDKSSGKREVILATPSGDSNTFTVESIPAFTYGVGLKDVIRLLDSASGTYEVVKYGKQIVVRLYVDGSLERPQIKTLIDDILSLGGHFEIGKNSDQTGGKSLLLIALDSELGFKRIEDLLKPFDTIGYQWEYGNVYDAEGNPLNWW